MVECQSSPSMRLITLGSGSTILVEESGTTWKNMSVSNGMLLANNFADSSAYKFLLLSMYSTIKPSKWVSILLMRAKYLSRVGSRAMRSFSIWLTITFEFVGSVHVRPPMALNLQSPIMWLHIQLCCWCICLPHW
jgi:hypothetical protein